MIGNSASGEYWFHLCSKFSKTYSRVIVLTFFCLWDLQWVRLQKSLQDGTVSPVHGRPQSWLDTSALADSTESHFSLSFPSVWPQELLALQLSSVQELRLLTSQTKQRWLWGSEEVGEHCCNPYYGREDTAGHRAPAQSSSFCNQLPECCASLEIRGSLPWKVTQQSSTRSLSWDKSCSMGPEGSGIQGETVTSSEKQWGSFSRTTAYIFREIGCKLNQQWI